MNGTCILKLRTIYILVIFVSFYFVCKKSLTWGSECFCHSQNLSEVEFDLSVFHMFLLVIQDKFSIGIINIMKWHHKRDSIYNEKSKLFHNGRYSVTHVTKGLNLCSVVDSEI